MAGEDEEQETSSEVELYAEALLTEMGPVPKIGIKLRHARKKRLGQLGKAAADRAGVDLDELGERVADADDDRVRDLFDQAVHRAVRVADEDYLESLGRLVGAALDDTQVLVADYMTSLLLQLDPVHLRVLLNCFSVMESDEDERLFIMPRRLDGQEVEYLLGINALIGTGVLQRLEAAGLLWNSTPPTTTTSESSSYLGREVGSWEGAPMRARGPVRPVQPAYWEPTGLAEEVVHFLFPDLADLRAKLKHVGRGR